jgi:hypothetical protein
LFLELLTVFRTFWGFTTAALDEDAIDSGSDDIEAGILEWRAVPRGELLGLVISLIFVAEDSCNSDCGLAMPTSGPKDRSLSFSTQASSL